MRYRPIDVRLWSDTRFLGLSDQGKLLWVFLLTTPSTIPIPGVIIGGEASLAEQLGWPVELFRGVFQEVAKAGLKVRSEGRVTWLSNSLKYQPPRNPNMVKAWAKFWDDIPEGPLKREIWQALRISCKSWSVLFNRLFPEVFGELFAQLLLGPFHTGTGTTTGTTTRTGTGTGSLSERESGPTKTVPLITDTENDRENLKKEIVSVIGPAHAKAFAILKSELGSTAMGPSVVDRFEKLRDLLDEMPSLDGAMERCQYSLAIREAEARHKRTLQFFGNAMWKRETFEKSLTFEIADVDGSRYERDARMGPTAIAMAELERIEREERESVFCETEDA